MFILGGVELPFFWSKRLNLSYLANVIWPDAFRQEQRGYLAFGPWANLPENELTNPNSVRNSEMNTLCILFP